MVINMAYEMFNYQPNPNDYYRDLMQSFIDAQWYDTSAKTPENGGALLEQAAIGSDEYNCIEAWIKPTVATTTRGLTDPADFNTLIFKSIDHTVVRGLIILAPYRSDAISKSLELLETP